MRAFFNHSALAIATVAVGLGSSVSGLAQTVDVAPAEQNKTDAVPLPELEVVGQKQKKKKPAQSPRAAPAKSNAPTPIPASDAAAGDAFPEGLQAATPGPFSDQQRAVYGGIGSSAYISGETLNRFSGTSPADILRGVPGVHVGDSRNGGAIDVNIRGLQGQRRVAVTVDGSEQALDTYRGYAGQQQRSYVDPELISSVAVTKGPSVSESAIGGTVAMTTLTPEDILLPGRSYGGRVRGSIASNSTDEPTEYRAKPDTSRSSIFDPQSGTGSVAVAARSAGLDFVGAYAMRNQGNYFAGKNGDIDRYRIFRSVGNFTFEDTSIATLYKPGEEVLNTSVDSDSVLLKTTLRPLDGHSIELGYRKLLSEYGEIMPSQIIRNTTGTIPQWIPAQIDVDTFTARYRIKPNDNPLLDFKLNAYYTDTFSDGFNGPGTYGPLFGQPAPNPFTEAGYKRAYGAKIQSERIGASFANTSKLATPAGNFIFDYGGSYTHEDVSPGDTRKIPLADLQQNRFWRDATRYELAAYSNVTWKPIDALTFEYGRRYSRAHTRDRNRLSVPQRHAIGRFIIFFRRNADGTESPVGNVFWDATADGQFDPATDPRNNPNSVVTLSNGTTTTYGALLASAPGAIRAQLSPINSRITGYVFNDPIERTDNSNLPTVRAAYELFEGTKLFTSYSQGARLPGIMDSTLWYSEANPTVEDLKPEHARNWEIGASTVQRSLFSKADEALLRVTYFDNEVKNFISRYEGPGASMILENNDSFSVKGTELQLAYDAGFLFGDVSYTLYSEAITCNARRAAERTAGGLGNTPACINGGFQGSYTNSQNPPRSTLNATVGVRLFDQKLSLGGRMIKTSDPIADLDKTGNGGIGSLQFPYPAVTIYDLFASYKMGDQAEATFNIDNVLDTYYVDPLYTSFNPSPGRTIRMGMTAKF